MYFMNVNMFKNKTNQKHTQHFIPFYSSFSSPWYNQSCWLGKRKTSYLLLQFFNVISTFYSFIYPPFIIAVFAEGRTAHPGIVAGERQQQQSVSLLPDLWSAACTGDRWQHKAPLLTTLITQRAFTYNNDNTKHLYLQRWQHKAPLLTMLTTQSTFIYNTDNTKHLYFQCWQHKAPLLTMLTAQSAFTFNDDNTKHFYLQCWQHKAPLFTTQSTFTFNADNTKHLYLQTWQHKASLLTTLTTQGTFTYNADNTKHLYLQQWQHKAPLLTTLTTQSTFTYNADNTKHLYLQHWQHKAPLLTTLTTQSTFTYNDNTKHLYLQQEWLYRGLPTTRSKVHKLHQRHIRRSLLLSLCYVFQALINSLVLILHRHSGPHSVIDA